MRPRGFDPDNVGLGLRARLLLGCSAVALLVSALGAGVAIGGAGSRGAPGGASSVSGSRPSMAPAPPVGALRIAAGVPEGFPDTRDGSVGAAIAFLTVEASGLMATPQLYRSAWQEMCTPAYFRSSGRAQAEAVLTDQETSNHLISNAAAGQRVYEHAFPLTATAVAYTDAVATVRTWSLVVAHPGDGPTVVSFGAGTLQLRWSGTDWKLDGGTASSSTADGASGRLLLDGGPQLPAYLGDPAMPGEAPAGG
jgi:hypothetical protein